MEKKKAHVAAYKKKIVTDLAKLLKSYPIIGALNMENLPASALQVMRGKLRKEVVMYMTKKRLILHAIDEVKDIKGIEKIKPYLKGMPALLFTKENPFRLYKTISASKSPAPAKPGQTAPMNIVIPAGPTAFPPGPIIGELAMFGIKTKVEGGKVAVQADTTVVKEGEVINQKVAELLLRFGIQPMELGLDLSCILEDGVVYDKKVLAIDEKKFLADLEKAASYALNLAVESAYPTEKTMELLVSKAFRESKSVALEYNVMCDLLAEELVEKAERQMLSVKEDAKVDEAFANLPKKEEDKPKEKKEEPNAPEPAPQAEEKKTPSKPVVTEQVHKSEQPKSEVSADEHKAVEEVKIVKTKEKLDIETSNIKEVKANNPEPITQIKRIVSSEKVKETKQGESLFEELKKKGTLRGLETKKESAPKPLSPMDIVRRANKEL